MMKEKEQLQSKDDWRSVLNMTLKALPENQRGLAKYAATAALKDLRDNMRSLFLLFGNNNGGDLLQTFLQSQMPRDNETSEHKFEVQIKPRK